MQPFRAQVEKISTAVSDTFDVICAKANALWNIEHDAEGHHTDITADSIDIAGSVAIGDGYIDADDALELRINGTPFWTISSAGDMLPATTVAQDLGSSSLILDHVYSEEVHAGSPSQVTLGATSLAFINGGTIQSTSVSTLTVSAGGTGTLALTDGANGGLIKLQTSGGSSRIQWASNENTGAGAAALGANCPAVTAGAPYTWLKLRSADGSDVYIPAWK